MESPSAESDTSIFTLQGRLGMVSFWRVTTHLALAFGHSNLAFHVRAIIHWLEGFATSFLLILVWDVSWIQSVANQARACSS